MADRAELNSADLSLWRLFLANTHILRACPKIRRLLCCVCFQSLLLALHVQESAQSGRPSYKHLLRGPRILVVAKCSISFQYSIQGDGLGCLAGSRSLMSCL